jgi:hypothetical protein
LLEIALLLLRNKEVDGSLDVRQKRKTRKQQDVVIRVNRVVYPIRMIKETSRLKCDKRDVYSKEI